MRRLICLVMSLLAYFAYADKTLYEIRLENHVFSPNVIEIPAYTKVTLSIINRDQTLEMFSSFTLNRNKLLLPETKTIIYLAPMPPGQYSFNGEYHPYRAIGSVVAVSKEKP